MSDEPARERMVIAALDLYRRNGMNGTGFTEILNAAGAARGAIYHHFPGGKEELTVAVIERNGAQVESLIHDAASRARSAQDAIRRLLDGYAEVLDLTDGTFGCPIAPSLLEARGAAPIREAAAAAFERWEDAVQDLLEHHGARKPKSREIAVLVIAVVEGALVLSRAAGSGEPMRTSGKQLARMLSKLMV